MVPATVRVEEGPDGRFEPETIATAAESTFRVEEGPFGAADKSTVRVEEPAAGRSELETVAVAAVDKPM